MDINPAIDNGLLREDQKAGNLKTKKAAVNENL